MAINESHATYGHIGEAALWVTLKLLGIMILLGIMMTGLMYSCEGYTLAKAKKKKCS